MGKTWSRYRFSPIALGTVTVPPGKIIVMCPLAIANSTPFAVMAPTDRSRFDSSSMYNTSPITICFSPLSVSIWTGSDAYREDEYLLPSATLTVTVGPSLQSVSQLLKLFPQAWREHPESMRASRPFRIDPVGFSLTVMLTSSTSSSSIKRMGMSSTTSSACASFCRLLPRWPRPRPRERPRPPRPLWFWKHLSVVWLSLPQVSQTGFFLLSIWALLMDPLLPLLLLEDPDCIRVSLIWSISTAASKVIFLSRSICETSAA